MKILGIMLAMAAIVGGADSRAWDAGKPLSVKVYGDSISTIYFPILRKDLAPEFEASHACWQKAKKCNNGQTQAILEHLPGYLRDTGQVDVITFNSGVHEIANGRAFVNGACTSIGTKVSPDDYRVRLNKIFDALKPRTKLGIWVDTTQIPPQYCAPPGALAQFNSVAEQAARDHGFWVLHTDSKWFDPDHIHPSLHAADHLAHLIEGCIRSAWKGEETAVCTR
ncbi:MAG TPA: SGNH/GDSL hydrolase family protein [Gammaproteobacteria bacterium]